MRPVSKGLGKSRLRALTSYGAGLYLDLDLDDVGLALCPPKSEEFSPTEHLLLAQMDLPGFQAREVLIGQGTQVEIRGSLRHEDSEKWLLRILELRPLGRRHD